MEHIAGSKIITFNRWNILPGARLSPWKSQLTDVWFLIILQSDRWRRKWQNKIPILCFFLVWNMRDSSQALLLQQSAVCMLPTKVPAQLRKTGLNMSIEQHPFKQMERGHKISLSTLLNVQRHLNESTHPLLPVDIWMSHISISHRILWASTIVHLNEPPNLLSHPTNLRRATKSYKPLQLNEPPNLIILYNLMSHKIL